MAWRDSLPTKRQVSAAVIAGFIVGIIGETDPPGLCFATSLVFLPGLLAVLAWRQRVWWGGCLLSVAAGIAFAAANSINVGLDLRLLPISVREDPAFTVEDDVIAMLVYAAMLAIIGLLVRVVGHLLLRATGRRAEASTSA